MDFHGMTYAEAAEQVGKEIATRPAAAIVRIVKPRQEQPENWNTEAEKLIAYAHRALMQNQRALSWLLDERGITRETAERFRLGWIDQDRYYDRETWGLSPVRQDDGRAKRMWVPSGLVIPFLDPDGRLLRVRIRRPVADRGPRYYILPGSDMSPMIIGDPHDVVGVIVESELDAILLAQEIARPLYIVALGSTSTKPSTDLIAALEQCPVVLVSLDFDDAGEEASRIWINAVQGAFWAPPIEGKDLTEDYLAGLDLNDWLSVALKVYVEDQGGVADEMFCRN
jgi:hypothetical protein